MSIKNLSSLKGIFPAPRQPPKRDFIKENKLKIRTSQKITNKHQENNENIEQNTRRTQTRQSYGPRSRSIPSHRINSGCSCVSKKSQDVAANTKPKTQRDTINCDKSVQTDDILDETFLADALRRCSTKTQQNHPSYRKPRLISTFTADVPDLMHLHPSDDHNFDVDLSQLDDDNHLPETQEPSLRKLHSRNDFKETLRDENNKVQSRISNRSDLRTHRDIKIPKYLEREKREKELQRLREMEKDPQCPKGHSAMSEEDRKAALTAAENKFRELVNELNRMPMSGETLRIRNRKMEIEKALVDLENTIRNFSKSKVYVKDNN